MSMFDRNNRANQRPEPVSTPTQPATRNSVSAIGPKTVIVGDITGEEDLVISGKVTGNISLPEHRVTIRTDGNVEADIVGQTIEVEGSVNGNLFGSQAVIVRNTGRVEGNLRAPRVTLEDGANFRGSIDMKPTDRPKAKAQPQQDQAQQKAAS